MRTLLASETVELDLEGKRRKIRFLNPDAGLVALEPRIPIHLSAFGLRGKALAAEIADRWMSFVGQLSRGLHTTLYKTAFTMGCVLGDGEPADSPRARPRRGLPRDVPRRRGRSVAADAGAGRARASCR